MRDKTLKSKNAKATPSSVEHWIERIDDECKAQFIRWATGKHIDISGIYRGEPVFRPAICEWEAWKAAWALKSKKRKGS